MWIVIALVALAVLGGFLWMWFRALPRRKSVAHVYTGELKSGKSLLAVRDCKYFFKKLYAKWKRGKSHRRPKIYSNIPLIIGPNWNYIIAHFIEYLQDRKEYKRLTRGKTPMQKCKIMPMMSKYYKWSDVLTREMLLLQEPFPEDVVPICLYDDIGASASQYSFNDPNIVAKNINDNFSCVETMMRYYAHHNGGSDAKFRSTEQGYGGIVINIRRRMGACDTLHDFHRVAFLPMFKVSCERMQTSDAEVVQNVRENTRETRKNGDYYVGYLPYKKKDFRSYDSECYEPTKYGEVVTKLPFTNWQDNPLGLKTNYIADLRMTLAEKAEYKKKVGTIYAE